ncbi:MAG: C10 family peptidase [Muribaculaceae bacterium]|nr:C10 family peptidase [Muribaculaceae bacterium]
MNRIFPILQAFKGSRAYISMLLLATVVILSGCSGETDDLSIPNSNAIVSKANVGNHISMDDAVVIANKVLKNDVTRSGLLNFPSFEYVVSGSSTRSASAADTLAYVLNYPDNSGFVIVATDRRVYPVLAFADEGNFSFENDNAKANFIDNIEAYLDNAVSDKIYDVTDTDFDGCYMVNPIVQISLNQRSPWDKYVIQEHPDCPVGCVAVATALVMSHSKYQINYHNSTFQLKSIIDAISEGSNNTNKNAPKRIVGGIPPTYTYEQAVDSMAKLLYWIGLDVNMKYSPQGSAAFSRDAYELCKSLNFSISSGYEKFDIKEIAQYLKDGHIIYLRGHDINGYGGHAWVSDGCYFCVDIYDSTQIISPYIHCDWGWGGSCNGYYSGDVFEASTYNFKPANYFAIKRMW